MSKETVKVLELGMRYSLIKFNGDVYFAHPGHGVGKVCVDKSGNISLVDCPPKRS